MSFGDTSSPITNFVTGFTKQFDQVLGPAFGYGKAGAQDATGTSSAPKPPPSLVNQKPQPVPVDTPGRHKTLLGQ